MPAPSVSLKPVVKASDKLKSMMNQAISNELQVSIQYMWQYVQAIGVSGFAIKNKFKEFGITEMKHAEAIAERLFYLEGTPATKPSPITVGDNLQDMLRYDAKAEADTIILYKDIIRQARSEGDDTTAFLFEGILKDEEEHHDALITILEEM